MVIRAAEPRDRDGFAALLGALAAFEGRPPPDAAALARLAGDLARGRFSLLVAEADGALVGFALYFLTYSTQRAQPSLFVEDLFVAAAARRRGLGERLMRELAGHAMALGCSRLEWCVRGDNAGALAFYRQLGARCGDDVQVCAFSDDGLAAFAGPRP